MDKDKLLSLFNELGIGYRIEHNDDETSTVIIEEGLKNVGGYRGFSAWFEFNKENDFIEVNIWE